MCIIIIKFFFVIVLVPVEGHNKSPKRCKFVFFILKNPGSAAISFIKLTISHLLPFHLVSFQLIPMFYFYLNFLFLYPAFTIITTHRLVKCIWTIYPAVIYINIIRNIFWISYWAFSITCRSTWNF